MVLLHFSFNGVKNVVDALRFKNDIIDEQNTLFLELIAKNIIEKGREYAVCSHRLYIRV